MKNYYSVCLVIIFSCFWVLAEEENVIPLPADEIMLNSPVFSKVIKEKINPITSEDNVAFEIYTEYMRCRQVLNGAIKALKQLGVETKIPDNPRKLPFSVKKKESSAENELKNHINNLVTLMRKLEGMWNKQVLKDYGDLASDIDKIYEIKINEQTGETIRMNKIEYRLKILSVLHRKEEVQKTEISVITDDIKKELKEDVKQEQTIQTAIQEEDKEKNSGAPADASVEKQMEQATEKQEILNVEEIKDAEKNEEVIAIPLEDKEGNAEETEVDKEQTENVDEEAAAVAVENPDEEKLVVNADAVEAAPVVVEAEDVQKENNEEKKINEEEPAEENIVQEEKPEIIPTEPVDEDEKLKNQPQTPEQVEIQPEEVVAPEEIKDEAAPVDK